LVRPETFGPYHVVVQNTKDVLVSKLHARKKLEDVEVQLYGF
jgi:hypothetical protein